MKNESISSLRLTLAGREGTGRLVVPFESFLGFDLWMTEHLEQLVDRWSDMATPRARRTTRSGPCNWRR